VGVPRQWSRDRALFDPNARFVAIAVNPQTKAVKTYSLTHEQYVDGADNFMAKQGLTRTG
jgi:hypothetical protein